MPMTLPISREAEFLLYQAEDGRTRVEVRFEGDTAWLSLGQMAELFQRDKSVISRHVKNVFDEGELDRKATVAESATVQREVEYFNLDVIISVGYRVKSHRGTQFRIWATQRLREYIVKGFSLDDERLKRGGGGNYFDELLARIRDIRSSEKVFWRKVLDITAYLEFAELQAMNRKVMYMTDWIAKLDDFLKLGDRAILQHAGRVSHEVAVATAEQQYDRFARTRAGLPSLVETHFDAAIQDLKRLERTRGAKPVPPMQRRGRKPSRSGG